MYWSKRVVDLFKKPLKKAQTTVAQPLQADKKKEETGQEGVLRRLRCYFL